MLGNYEEKIADAQEVFNQILKSVSGELQNKEIHEVEEELFRTVLKIPMCQDSCHASINRRK